MKPTWLTSQILPKKIASIDFSILSPEDILQLSEVEVNTHELYDEIAYPVNHGPLDPKMGVGNQQSVCNTCHKKLQECVGHFGHTHLSLPIYHIGYFKHLVVILKMVCKKCCRVLSPDIEIEKNIQRMTKLEQRYVERTALFKKLYEEISKNKVCPHCKFLNPVIQKIPKVAAKIEVRHPSMKHEILDERVKRKEKVNPSDKQRLKGDFIYELNPWDALRILNNIPPREWILVNVGGATQIQNFIIKQLPVPPICIRPSLKLSTSTLTNEDDLTMNIKYLLKVNNELEQFMLKKGDEINRVNKKWYVLQSYLSQYINGDTPGLPLNDLKYKQIKSLCNRLKGKQGRFRQNLSGKRSNFTARTVISPDPNLRPDEVIVPEHVSKIVTISDSVTHYSIQRLTQCIEKGPKLGGANFVIKKNGQKMLVGSTKHRIELEIGDTVERHLRDGDIVIFNRQPSLHRLSMMGFKVKVKPSKTLRFNECVCAPFNADFDGDQMNIHVPQTYEARSQVLHLMGVQHNIITPKSGEPIIALIQDFLTTSFLITSKDIFFNRQQFTEILSYFADASQLLQLPPPTIIMPTTLWTGKQVISSLIRPNKFARVIVNLTTKQKIYTENKVMCLKDGWVIFKNSQLLSGQLGKNTLGGNKSGLIYTLLRDNTSLIACEVMHRISKLSARWLSNYGMTIGISDVTPSAELSTLNIQVIDKAHLEFDKYQKEYKLGKLQSKPGMTVEETLESQLNQTLSKVRQTIGQNCISHLDRYNKPLIMALCGSKGSPVNLSQMIGCVGQQTVGGKRIKYGFTERTLPHFQRLTETPQSRGFVANSFYTGLTPTQFFYHTMGGRQGIIDTAVKTADTGYMQRRLIKLLEDIGIMYDRTVRNCDRKQIIQFRYGGDGFDPMKTEDKDNPINFKNLEVYVKNLLNGKTGQKFLDPDQIRQMSRKFVDQLNNKKILGVFQQEKDLLKDILQKVIKYFDEKAEMISSNLTHKYSGLNARDETYLKKQLNGITDRQLILFFNLLAKKLNKCLIQPGEAIGALTAQSIGEPATQMTLKTFHFAGISSMNITQGVPRVNQIINCTKNIATPIVNISLVQGTRQQAIRVKNATQKLVLGKILHSIQQIYSAKQTRLQIVISPNKLKQLEIKINIDYIVQRIWSLKSKIKKVEIIDDYRISIVPQTKTNIIFQLKTLRRKLVSIQIGGISTITRALISKSNDRHVVYAEGLGLGEIFGIPGVDYRKTFSNHIVEIQHFLGIQAARNSIVIQITQTMNSHGVNVNSRHVALLAEVMACKGRIIGFTRNGVDKMKDSTIMLASFEKTIDFLYDAATQGKHDRMRGVSQKIITGQTISVGTGMFDIEQDFPKKAIYGKC